MDKRLIVGLCAVIVVVGIIVVCANTDITKDSKEQRMMGEVLGENVIELPVITEIDSAKAFKYFDENYGKYDIKYGCTTVGKVLENGDMVIGRSDDLPYSYSPAYVIRTDIDGFYKTIGIAYNGIGGQSFEDVKKNGLSQTELYMTYAASSDVLNEKGLYLEANMREGQPEETGMAVCSGTNPGADVRLSYANVCRYLSERAATVEEALELIYKCDVYGLKNDKFNWGGGIFMADSTGHYGVLEVVDNKLVWNEKQQGQANFYLSPEYKDKAVYGPGIGRYNTLMAGIESVTSEKDMLNLINKVRYQQMYDPDTCQFDATSDLTGVDINGKKYTIKDLENPEIHELLTNVLRLNGEKVRSMTLDELKSENVNWISGYQIVTNCNTQEMTVQFFEDTRLTYHFSLNEEEEA